METELIDRLYALAERACQSKNNAFGYGIWSHHIKPMVDIARKLAKQFGADEEIVIIATLLHDLAGIQNSNDKAEHHMIGAKKAEQILNSYNYPAEKIKRVKQCIQNHRGSVNNQKHSIEETCVADADAIVHMTEVPSLFYAAFKEMGMSIDVGKKWLREKIQRDWDKMSANSKKLFKHKYQAVMEVLL